jgi:hypothetical protein
MMKERKMKKTSPTKLVRAFMTINRKGTWLFSDKTTFGRSIKVWGFSTFDYEDCAKIIRDHGYEVKIVYTPKWNTRLWVGAR